MRYCKKCVIPDTRPNITFDDSGICNACRAAETKREIAWDERERAFRKVVENAKSKSRGHDCIVPVSGGKDSTWQIVKCLEYGLNPLAVTWRAPGRTEIGQRNLDNLISLGVDHIDYQISPKVERKFMYEALTRLGSTAIPMHMAIHAIPLSIAVRDRIPLIIWGENSAFEYGGTADEQKGFALDQNWMKKYGVTQGTTAQDWVSSRLTEKELTPYFSPNAADLEKAGVLAIFLGYYFEWDVEASLAVAKKHGFETRTEGPKTGYYDYADIDDDFISIHHYLKWYKFGFTRLFDNLSIEIRTGRLKREEAVKIIGNRGDDTPREDIQKLCRFLDITEQHFFEVIEKFRNPDVWQRDDGVWKIKDFLISDWSWS